MAKIVVGISGGVDSSVAAHLLKEQGHEVIGMFMQNWHDTTGVLSGDCPWEEDMILARLVARKLDIPFYHVDLSEKYRQRVVEYLFSEYEKGRTPNPDVLCNREIKFDVFVDEAKKMGAEFVATGHYCQKRTDIINGIQVHSLVAGADPNKDQSYFLCQLNQQQLAIAMFPIGHLLKPEVREIAAKLDLPTAERKDSQGICFIGKVDLPVFLQQKLNKKEGKIVELPKELDVFAKYEEKCTRPEEYLEEICNPIAYSPALGKTIGKHGGAHFYTIGQRKGINIGGKAEPLFVVATDVTSNIVYTGQGHDHPALNRKGLFINCQEVHWARPDKTLQPGERAEYMVRIRYRQPLEKATLIMKEEGLYILFDRLQRGIASGQFAAWYENDVLVGSGTINA